MKKAIRIILIFIITLFASNIFSQWTTVSIGTTKHLNSICTPDLGVVYAVGDTGYIRVSTNGGSVYVDRSINLLANLRSIKAFGTTFAYICGDQGVIAKTTNAGVNWVGIGPSGSYNYLDLDFLNSNTGLIVGQSRRFAYTVNGGVNWITGQLNTPGSLNLSSTCVEMTDSVTSFIASSDTLIAGLYYSYIHRSTNSGVNYTNVFSHVATSRVGFIDMQFVTYNLGFAAMTNGTFVKTTNGGTNWYLQSPMYTTQARTFYFVSDLTGYAVGDNYNYKKTTNGGVNWYLQNSGGNVVMNDNYFFSESVGYVAGNGGFIMKTATSGGGFVGINQTGIEIPNEYNLSQNYPNPFNPSTNISFDIPTASHVKLSVYNILGVEVKVLADENMTAGRFEAQFNASDLPSGTYFYRLKADNFTETKKMILIK